jgi:hypothetical protein
MKKLNFATFKFLTENDKKALTFLHNVIKKNNLDRSNEFMFVNLFDFLVSKYGKSFSLYDIYKYSMILRYHIDALERDEVHYSYNTEEDVISTTFFDHIIKQIIKSEKFKLNLNHLQKTFDIRGETKTCFIDLEEFKVDRSMIYSTAHIKCINVEGENIYRRENTFFIDFDIPNFNDIEITFQLFERKKEKFIMKQPWGNIKNITIENLIKMLDNQDFLYRYENFFDDYLYEITDTQRIIR